jgi:glycerophosphoryl diester phosphodiesterase
MGPGVSVIGGIYEAADLAALAALGVDVNVWTINDAGDMRALLEAGVNMIITDEPDVLLTARAAVCAETCGD